MLASALSGLLAFVPNPMLSQLGLASSMGLGGYALATSKTDPRRKQQERGMSTDREVRRLKQELADVQTRIRTLSRDRKQLADELTQVQSARAALVTKVKSLETVAGDKAINPFIDICEYTQQLQTLRSAIADKDAQVSELATALEAANDGTAARVAAVRAETLLTGSARLELESEVEQLTNDKQKLTAAYRSLNTALENAGLQYDAELSELDGIKESQDKEALATIQHWKQQAANLAARISELEVEAKKPARFGGLGASDVMGNQVIDFFVSKGIQFLAHETDPDLDKGLLVSLKAETPVDLETVTKFMGELELATGTFSRPKVTFSQRCYHFRLAVNEPFRTGDKVEPKTKLSRFEETLDKAMHVRICAGSGGGKTTLLNNIIHYLQVSLDNATVKLLDPKAVDDFGAFTPDYYGAECVTGIQALANDLGDRVERNVAAKKAGKALPIYSPVVFAVDEAQVLYLDAQNADDSYIKERGEQAPMFAKKAKGSLAKLLSLGRAYKAMGVFVTQLPQVTKVGLNEGSFDPCVNIFMAAQMDAAIDGGLEGLGLTKAQLKSLEKELTVRRSFGQEYLMLVVDIPNTDAYFVEAPRPHYYETLYPPILGAKSKMDRPVQNVETFGPSEVAAIHIPEKLDGENPESTPRSTSESSPVQVAPNTAKDCDKGRCPTCDKVSLNRKGKALTKAGKARFYCENNGCEKTTFSAPLI